LDVCLNILVDAWLAAKQFFCTTIVQSFRGLRKFYRRFLPFSNKRLGLFSRQDAKNAKFGKHFFLCGLCAFARDIPIFGCGFAALGSFAVACR
jgi:hypothetical protein